MWGCQWVERLRGDYLSCIVTNLSLSNFGGSNCESSDGDASDDVEGINTDVKYYEWRRNDDSHVKKPLVGVSKNEALVLLRQQIKVLKKHIFVKRCQVKHYNELKQNLKKNEIILHVDFNKTKSSMKISQRTSTILLSHCLQHVNLVYMEWWLCVSITLLLRIQFDTMLRSYIKHVMVL